MLSLAGSRVSCRSRLPYRSGKTSPSCGHSFKPPNSPAMNPEDTFKRVAADLVGMEVGHLWRGYGSAIFLEFGALSPRRVRRDGSLGNPLGELTICIEWSWRIEGATSIICGSWSEEELWEPAFDLLRGSRVTGLSLFGRLPEISLALSEDRHLLSFATAEGQPAWNLTDRRSSPDVWLSVRDGLLFESDGTDVPPQ